MTIRVSSSALTIYGLIALLLSGCGMSERGSTPTHPEISWDSAVSAYDRANYDEVLSILRSPGGGELMGDERYHFYLFLALFHTGRLEEAEAAIVLIEPPLSLDRINLVAPVRALNRAENPGKLLHVYVAFLEHLGEKDFSMTVKLRMLETVRIVSQRYVGADWIDEDLKRRLNEMEDDLSRYISESVPLGSVRSRVE